MKWNQKNLFYELLNRINLEIRIIPNATDSSIYHLKEPWVLFANNRNTVCEYLWMYFRFTLMKYGVMYVPVFRVCSSFCNIAQ